LAETKKELRVPPEALSVIYLDEISARLAAILNHLEQTTPKGVDVLVFEDTIDSIRGIDPVRDYPYHPLFRIEVINKGPATVHAKVNNEQEIPIETDEIIPFEKPKAQITYITIRPEASTTIKILGRY